MNCWTSYLTLCALISLWVKQGPLCYHYLPLLWRLNKLLYVKQLEEGLEYSQNYVSKYELLLMGKMVHKSFKDDELLLKLGWSLVNENQNF